MTYHSDQLTAQLVRQAQELRIAALTMIFNAKSGHPGGSLSCADIIAALYFHQMRIDPSNPDWPDRDRFILSKGHAAPTLYAALAELGYFPKEKLMTSFRTMGCMLQGHPDRTKTPGVDMNSGPLGNGLSVGAGLALSARMRGAKYRTYVLTGDGELAAGVIWEAAMTAAKYKLDNLTAIVDHNGVQLGGPVCDVMPVDPLADKWIAFGWHVIEIDGHNIHEIITALDAATNVHSKPCVIIARTTKGKGISYMENDCHWHSGPPSPAMFEQAIRELQEAMP